MMMRMQDYKSKQFWLGAALALAMTFLLVWLGLWQLQRLEWKNALIQSFTQSETLAEAPNFEAWNVPLGNPQPVLFFGHYIPQGTVIVTQNDTGIVYTPFKTNDGVIIMMRRGTVPVDNIPGLVLGTYDNEKTIPVVGVPLPRPRIFPFMHITNNGSLTWPFLDWSAVRYRFSEQPLAPYVVSVMDEPTSDLNVTRTQPEIRNQHMQYAVFWFIMAAVCAVLFGRFLFTAPRGE